VFVKKKYQYLVASAKFLNTLFREDGKSFASNNSKNQEAILGFLDTFSTRLL
jgi:hypothetical protein